MTVLTEEKTRFAGHEDMPLSFLTQLQENGHDIREDSSILATPHFSNPDTLVSDEVSRAGGSFWCPHFTELDVDALARARELGLAVAV